MLNIVISILIPVDIKCLSYLNWKRTHIAIWHFTVELESGILLLNWNLKFYCRIRIMLEWTEI